jgi:hypothetical protein
METTIDDQSNSDFMQETARPQFLSVLCILTWIACGLMFVTTIWGVVFKDTPEEQYEQIEKIRESSPEMADQMEVAIAAQEGSNQVLATAINLLAIAVSAFGAYLMWQLKRRGFFMYIGGEILPYLGMFFGGTAAMSGSFGTMMAFAIGVMVVFDIAFIIMYGANLKYMTK